MRCSTGTVPNAVDESDMGFLHSSHVASTSDVPESRLTRQIDVCRRKEAEMDDRLLGRRPEDEEEDEEDWEEDEDDEDQDLDDDDDDEDDDDDDEWDVND